MHSTPFHSSAFQSAAMANERRSAVVLCAAAIIWLCIALSSPGCAADEDHGHVVLAGAAPPKRSAAKSPSPSSSSPSPSPSPSSPSSSPAPSPAPAKRRAKRPSKSPAPSPAPSPSPSAATPVDAPATPNGGMKRSSFAPAAWGTAVFCLALVAMA